MKTGAVPLLVFMLAASPCLAQDDNSFVQHVRSSAEQQYEPSQRGEPQKTEKTEDAGGDNPPQDNNDFDTYQFVQSYFYAYRNGDIGQLRMLVSSDNLKCLDSMQDDYFRNELASSSHTGDINTLRWRPIDTEQSQVADDGEQQQPRTNASDERQIVIHWKEDAATFSRDVTLVRSNGRYYQKISCSGSDTDQTQDGKGSGSGRSSGTMSNENYGDDNNGYNNNNSQPFGSNIAFPDANGLR